MYDTLTLNVYAGQHIRPRGGASSREGVNLPYVTVTIRVPEQVANQAREIAKISGWQFADYLRTLICLGEVFFFLSFASPKMREAAGTLLGGLELLKLSRSFSLDFSERPYKFRVHGRKSSLVTLNLPKAMCDMVTTYAGEMKASRNEAYSKCLQQGLLVYSKAQTVMLQSSRK